MKPITILALNYLDLCRDACRSAGNDCAAFNVSESLVTKSLFDSSPIFCEFPLAEGDVIHFHKFCEKHSPKPIARLEVLHNLLFSAKI